MEGVRLFESRRKAQLWEISFVRVVGHQRQALFLLNWWLGLLLVGCLSVGYASSTTLSAADGAKVDRLLELISERLNIAPEVARIKWNTKAPIEDLAREKQIIDGVVARAGEYSLDSRVLEAFFTAQIEASKIIQNSLHAEWMARGQPPFAKVADLSKDIRPALDQLTPAMMQALAEALPVLQRPGGRQLLEQRSEAILAELPGGGAAVQAAVAPLLMK